jgi:hypothetical protein
MRRFIRVLAATALMVVLMATTVSPAFANNGNGWGSCTGGCGHKEGVAWRGHTAGTPNGFCSETFEYAYNCNKVTKE